VTWVIDRQASVLRFPIDAVDAQIVRNPCQRMNRALTVAPLSGLIVDRNKEARFG
jgi:hypothetical protein